MAQTGGKLPWNNDSPEPAAHSAEVSKYDAEQRIGLVLNLTGGEGLDATNDSLRFSPATGPIFRNKADLKVLCEWSSRVAGAARSREGLRSAAMRTSHLCGAAFHEKTAREC